MFIPLRTERVVRRTTVVTNTLVLLNMVVFLAGVAAHTFGVVEIDRFIDAGSFKPTEFKAWQLVTYQFLHDPGGIWHLGFNMLFLWVFGRPVEDRLGRPGFIAFYLAGGVAAGLAHAAVDHNHVIGASGSISAVTGGFLALFPRTRVQILFIFFFIGVFAIPALWLIAIFFTLDLLRSVASLLGGGGSNVAYMAHLAGYVYGFVICVALLATHVLPNEDFDVFYLWKQARRRAAFRGAGRGQVGGLWSDASADTGEQLARKARKRRAEQPADPQVLQKRAEINRLIANHELEAAAAAYRALLADDPRATLAEDRQLDIANQLYAQKDHERAATAYELLLERYPGTSHRAEVSLLLGALYVRHLHRPQRARELIEGVKERLTRPEEQALAGELLAEAGP